MLRLVSNSSFLGACLFGSVSVLVAACGSDSPSSKATAPDGGGDETSSGGSGGEGNASSGGTGSKATTGGGGSAGKTGGSGANPGGGSNGGAGGTKPGTGGANTGAGGSYVPPISVVDPPSGGTPAPAGTTDLPLSKADALPGAVNVAPNRSSVILYLPKVTGARDFRVFAVENGVKVSVGGDNREHVDGATIHCAGLRQRNQCDMGEILPVKYNNEQLDGAQCDAKPGVDRKPNVPTQLMQTLEVDGVGKDVTFVVEAIDRQCPFPGLFGTKHRDVKLEPLDGPTVNATVNGKAYTLKHWPDSYPVRTEADIRKDYGSMILNGQGPNLPVTDTGSPDFPESPFIRVGLPAPADDPVVLARSVIKVSATGTAALPEGFKDTDFFDDFDDSTDQVKFVRKTDPTATLVGIPVNVLETKKEVFYDVGAYEDAGRGFSDIFVDRGQLNMVMGDPSQGSMSLQAMYPKRAAHLPDAADQYLHITYSAQRIETSRRYENLVMCGSDAGQVFDGAYLKAAPLPRPGFMDVDAARRTNPLGWECIYFVPRGGGFTVLPGGDPNTHSDSSLRVTVMKKQPLAANGAAYDSEVLSDYTASMGPDQDVLPKTWVRQIDSAGKLVGPWLDDQLNVWQKTRFDVFLRRDRFITYVNGEQRLCGDLSASPLKMAEGAVGFWHILYHSNAEFNEIRDVVHNGAPYTGLHHVLHNEPFADQRSWDNVGFRENVAAPANFDASRCR
jgi:hypothetical protein